MSSLYHKFAHNQQKKSSGEEATSSRSISTPLPHQQQQQPNQQRPHYQHHQRRKAALPKACQPAERYAHLRAQLNNQYQQPGSSSASHSKPSPPSLSLSPLANNHIIMPYSQTHSPNSWMVNVETPNNGPLLLSPPHNNSLVLRENMQVTQPSSAPTSPLGSPGGALGSTTPAAPSPFQMPSSAAAAAAAAAAGGAVAGSATAAGAGAANAAAVSGSASAGAAAALHLNNNTATPSSSSSAAAAAAVLASATSPPATTSSSSSLSASSSSAASASSSCASAYSAAVPAAIRAAAIDTGDPNWQATKATVRERNKAMFNNDLMADVTFVVGGAEDGIETIPAHKYVLATGSSVFYAMFFGGLADTEARILVPDVEPVAFLTLLKFLYCDEIQLEADNVLATLYAAKKYIVPHLARACVHYLETSLTAKNACLLLSQSRLFEEPELMQRCWEVIDAQAEMAIKSEGFVDIDINTFESILARETLNCKEINLFEAALCWAQSACQKLDIDTSATNRRHALGKALQLIRIPTMTLEEFANGVAQLGILTADETIDIFLNFTATVKPALAFETRPRAGLKTQCCHRFQSCAYRSNQWRYRGRCDSIQFNVDKRIFIVGFGLYGSSTGAADYNVKIELKRMGRVLAENKTHFYSDGSSNTFHVFFEDPIQVEPDCFYTASVVLDGTELSFFGQEGIMEVCMGNVTFQFQCSSESTNGTGVQGGQIPELIFYGPTRPEGADRGQGGGGGSVEGTTTRGNGRDATPTTTMATAGRMGGGGLGAGALVASVTTKGNNASSNGGNNNEGD